MKRTWLGMKPAAVLFVCSQLGWLSGCGIVGVSCGGLAALLCGEGLYCLYDEGSCGDDGASGACAQRPDSCAEIFAPVCGCDGATYGNACEAAVVGVSVRSEGACPTDDEQKPCGGLAGFACPASESCKYTTGTCGAADQTGVCVSVPEVCAEVFAPVCGCDEITYPNECEADRASISVLGAGECADAGRVCGGIVGIGCEDGEYCHLPMGQCCCDIQGLCEPIPQVCTLEFAPVCGCDAVTYGNACQAAGAGASISGEGECPTPQEP